MKRTLTMLLILCCIITAIPVSAHPSEYITRLEFCRLADKMLIQSDIIQNNTDAVSPFCDTDDKAVVMRLLQEQEKTHSHPMLFSPVKKQP